jgi:hypothetical protein
LQCTTRMPLQTTNDLAPQNSASSHRRGECGAGSPEAASLGSLFDARRRPWSSVRPSTGGSHILRRRTRLVPRVLAVGPRASDPIRSGGRLESSIDPQGRNGLAPFGDRPRIAVSQLRHLSESSAETPRPDAACQIHVSSSRFFRQEMVAPGSCVLKSRTRPSRVAAKQMRGVGTTVAFRVDTGNRRVLIGNEDPANQWRAGRSGAN